MALTPSYLVTQRGTKITIHIHTDHCCISFTKGNEVFELSYDEFEEIVALVRLYKKRWIN
jgi:hypothetical protein